MPTLLLSNITHISCGFHHGMAIEKDTQHLITFGSNQYGQYGLGNDEPVSEPYKSDTQVTHIHAYGNSSVIVLASDNTLQGTGACDYGQLATNQAEYAYQLSWQQISLPSALTNVTALHGKGWNLFLC